MKSFFLYCLIFCSLTYASSTVAQTVYAGETTVDKVKLPGLYLTVPGDGKQIEKDWEAKLQTFGRTTSSRGTYRVTNGSIPEVSPEPINLTSTVKTTRSSATIFASFNLGNNNFVTPGSAGYAAAEALLKSFSDSSLHGQEVRVAESSFDEAQRNHQKLVRNGERLQREIEQNAKEKERLLKRIEENVRQLDQLNKDVATNKTEQDAALVELENQKKNVEMVKTRKTN